MLRSEFDEILLRHASRQGAEVSEEVSVEEIAGLGPFRVEARTVDGEGIIVEARHVVDASGQQALLGRRHGLREFNPFFKNLAIWSYFADAARMEGPLRDNILSAAHGEGWCWYIPLHDGTISVGAVVDAARWKERAHPDGLQETYPDPDRRGASPWRRCYAAGVRSLRCGSSATTRTRAQRFFHGEALLAGDAACFIDPVFSTGVHLACLAGLLAADALEEVLSGRRDGATALEDYDATYRRAFERYRRFVTFFYNHHADPDSYFWQARKLVDSDGPLELREAFVRLIAGTGDIPNVLDDVRETDERWSKSLAAERARSAPGMHLMRVAATLAEMRRIAAHSS